MLLKLPFGTCSFTGTLFSQQAFCSLIVCIFLANIWVCNAQEKKPETHLNHKTLHQASAKEASKSKKFEEFDEFVIVDFRNGAVANVVEPEDEGSNLKGDLQARFPANTIFNTTNPQVCVVGVENPANAKAILSHANSKASRQVKRSDLEKTLSKINVKLVTKEK